MEKQNTGWTPLMIAADTNDLATAKRLIDNGVDVNTKNSEGQTALMLLTKSDGFIETTEKLLDLLLAAGAQINDRDKEGVTPLMFATRWNTLRMVQYLVAQGADVNARDNNGRTALMRSEYKLSYRISGAYTDFFLRHGAEINARDRNGHNAFLLALLKEYPSLDAIKYLASKGADVNAQDNEGKTALMLNYDRANDGKTLDYLLSVCKNVNAKDTLGRTLLMQAAYDGNVETVKKLVAAGADMNIQDTQGMTALMLAVKYQPSEYAEFLKSKGIEMNARTLEEFKNHLGSKGVRYEISDDDKLSILIDNNYSDIVRHLISKGASITVGDKDGNQFQHHAAINLNVEYISLAVNAGGDINSRNNERKDVLMLIMEAESRL